VTLTVSPRSSAPSAGGGGALGLLELAWLAALGVRRGCTRRPRKMRPL